MFFIIFVYNISFWAGAFVVFSAKLSVPIFVQWVPCPCFPLFSHYFYKKLSLYIHMPNVYLGLGFEFGPQRIRDWVRSLCFCSYLLLQFFSQKYVVPFPFTIVFVGLEILACLNVKSCCLWKILVDLLQLCILLFKLLLQDITVFWSFWLSWKVNKCCQARESFILWSRPRTFKGQK